MQHRDLIYPLLIWGSDYAFVAKDYFSYEKTPKYQFDRLRNQAINGKVKILTSDGMMFRVSDEIIISSQRPILKWMVEFRTAPILTNGRKVDLSEFKKMVEQAVRVRQQGDYDADYLGRLMAVLPDAKTYEEAINCVPRVM